ncbi:MAG: GDSL-type esterase/lipase family protein, partial [Anaerolineae bacterium]
LEPDLVIIYHSTNDVDARLVDPAAYRGDNSGARKQWHEPPIRWWERSTLLRIVGRKLDWGDQVRLRDFVDAPTMLEYTGGDRTSTLQQNPPVYFRRNLANMIAVAQENGVAVMLATWAHTTGFKDHASKPYYQQAYREQNAIVIELGRSHDIPVFDFAALMPADHRYWADGRHVNEAGAQLKAELFAQFIDQAGLIPRP